MFQTEVFFMNKICMTRVYERHFVQNVTDYSAKQKQWLLNEILHWKTKHYVKVCF